MVDGFVTKCERWLFNDTDDASNTSTTTNNNATNNTSNTSSSNIKNNTTTDNDTTTDTSVFASLQGRRIQVPSNLPDEMSINLP